MGHFYFDTRCYRFGHGSGAFEPLQCYAGDVTQAFALYHSAAGARAKL
jgi:hypothetical protein